MGDEPNRGDELLEALESGDPEAMVGKTLDGRYRLKRFISQGGMGAVYEGEHVTIRRPIAVKILHAAMAQVPDLIRRFEREAFAIGRIEHPNCIRISDFGELTGGALFLVMEYLDGISLADEVDEHGALGTPRALRVLRHILRGLAHVHRAGIVHRDIKPENVMLIVHDGERDFAKLLDFGIAKLVGEAKALDDHDLTQAGMAFGTPTYMSPEQALGEPADARSDLYQATLLFFEMLAGRPPFRCDDKIELLAMHATRPPPEVEEFNSRARIGPEIRKLLEKGLAKRATDRWQNADEYLEAVDAAIDALGVTPPPRLDTPPPSMSMAQPPKAAAAKPATLPLPKANQKHVKGFVIGAVVLTAVGAFAALALPSGDEGEESKTDQSSLAARAANALELGKPDEAIELLTSKEQDISEDAAAQLLLGHAYAAKNRTGKTLETYKSAIATDDALRDDATLRANLDVLLRDKKTFIRAAPVLVQQLDDAVARSFIVERAVLEGDGEWRHLALEAAEKLGFESDLDLRKLYELDLVEGSRCNNRRKAVAKLRALGDPAAIEALERARTRKGKSGRWRGKNINSCLKDDAKKAIQFLRSRKP